MLLIPAPGLHTIELWIVIIRIVIDAHDDLVDFLFLLKGQEEVPVRSNSEILAAFLFEATVYPTFTADRVEIVGIERAVGEGVAEGLAQILLQVPPVVELELIRCARSVKYGLLALGSHSTHHFQRVGCPLDLHLPDISILVVKVAEVLNKFDVGMSGGGERGQFGPWYPRKWQNR
jgi:hypothetical protein